MELKPKVLQNCNKCGLCLSVCPTYKAAGQEHASPRARLQLINYFSDQKIKSTVNLKEIISKCLMCGSCTAICPSGIDHYLKFIKMRAAMVHDHGERAAIKSLVFLLAREYRIRLAAGLGEFARRVIPETFFKRYNLGNISLKSVPQFNRKPFRKALPEVIEPEKDCKGTLVYFTGCATNYVFDKTGFATINILKQMGFRIIIPAKQTCCGIPMLFHGALDQAENNILTNIECLNIKDIRAVIVDCPTCGAALKNEYPSFLKNRNKDASSALEISSRVMDIMSFLLKNLESILPEKKVQKAEKREKIKVTYHLPCHLKNGLKAPDTSEQVLKAISGIEYIKADDRDECCGGGGTFFYEYPEISKKMVDKKVENAKKTRAEIWLTDCPVCRINLSGNLADDDLIKVRHPVEIFNQFVLTGEAP